ncbi:50S ribosomal protein L19 [Fibrobacter sp. UWEL]|uniref:50S ribosomal protein L19 n=1 Tax=Fibrobacter sp. UWEL TaxID=1896209 RepID=UPI000916B656|nr:50S ribosomal protein L19 [Fibrobacter sp. UWEL]SHK55068.1 LSU ribosomal protein L19P [Fibrobacter sp. UWEL]
MSLNIEALQNENVKTDLPEFRAGDTVTVNVKVIEGTKERIQPFKGVIIQVKNSGISKTITVRKMSSNVAVERIFPVNSPRIASILLDRPGKVRQARIYYMRDLRGKAARIDERQ